MFSDVCWHFLLRIKILIDYHYETFKKLICSDWFHDEVLQILFAMRIFFLILYEIMDY
jgi:hypothetical protein